MAALSGLFRKSLPWLAALTAGASIATSAGAAPIPLEYAVKANYLSKFAPFVNWPRGALAAGAPFTICLLGQHSFGSVLDDAVRGQSIEGRPVTVRRIEAAQSFAQCQILFVGRTGQPASQILRAAASHPILTVTDRDRAARGGMIDFVLERGRVRFVVDAAAARASGLQISSKLLALALSVSGR